MDNYVLGMQTARETDKVSFTVSGSKWICSPKEIDADFPPACNFPAKM
jgi:hypothetical protein